MFIEGALGPRRVDNRSDSGGCLGVIWAKPAEGLDIKLKGDLVLRVVLGTNVFRSKIAACMD